MTHRGPRGLDAPPIPVALCLMVGVMVCIAWAFDLPYIRELVPGRPAMQLTSAICFIAAGVMLYFTDRYNGRGIRVRIASAALILMIMGWTWTGYVFMFDPHLDEVIGAGTAWPGRPSIGGAFALTTAGVWGILLRTRYAIPDQTAGVIVMMVAVPAIIGHAIGQPMAYYQGNGGAGMALNTAVLTLVLGAGIHGRDRGGHRAIDAAGTLAVLLVTAISLAASGGAKLAVVKGPPEWPTIDAGSSSLRGR